MTERRVQLGPRRSLSMWRYVLKRNARSFAVMRLFNIDPSNAHEILPMDSRTLKRLLDTVQYLAENRPIDRALYIDDEGKEIR